MIWTIYCSSLCRIFFEESHAAKINWRNFRLFCICRIWPGILDEISTFFKGLRSTSRTQLVVSEVFQLFVWKDSFRTSRLRQFGSVEFFSFLISKNHLWWVTCDRNVFDKASTFRFEELCPTSRNAAGGLTLKSNLFSDELISASRMQNFLFSMKCVWGVTCGELFRKRFLETFLQTTFARFACGFHFLTFFQLFLKVKNGQFFRRIFCPRLSMKCFQRKPCAKWFSMNAQPVILDQSFPTSIMRRFAVNNISVVFYTSSFRWVTCGVLFPTLDPYFNSDELFSASCMWKTCQRRFIQIFFSIN